MLRKKIVNITIASLAAIVLFGALHSVAAVGPPYNAASGSTSMGGCREGSGSINTYASNGQITANWECANGCCANGQGWLELLWRTTASTDWYVTTTISFSSMNLGVECCCCWGDTSWTMSFLVIDQSTGQTVLNQQFYSCEQSNIGTTNCNQGQTISYQSNTFWASAQHNILYEVVVNAHAQYGSNGSINIYVTNMSAGAFSSPCHHPAPALSSPTIAPKPTC